ncbi:hypothetical protein F2Q69_00013140 [Brassica cretica]|uniref:Uncharacterized protein n=1 Tax=Brassica cretica TaxID=69181 RepID=A0A8S9R439_BRACR|nr:hypothetical protein F2Q69_00013140 [Brassica cretica]
MTWWQPGLIHGSLSKLDPDTCLKSLHPVINTPKIKPALLFMLRNEDFLDVDCNIAEVMILNFKSCESLLFSNLFQRDCPSVLLEDKQKASWSRSYTRCTEEWLVCLARGSCRGDEGLSIDETVFVSVYSDTRIWAEHIL